LIVAGALLIGFAVRSVFRPPTARASQSGPQLSPLFWSWRLITIGLVALLAGTLTLFEGTGLPWLWRALILTPAAVVVVAAAYRSI
jgi:hypothetical protein